MLFPPLTQVVNPSVHWPSKVGLSAHLEGARTRWRRAQHTRYICLGTPRMHQVRVARAGRHRGVRSHIRTRTLTSGPMSALKVSTIPSGCTQYWPRSIYAPPSSHSSRFFCLDAHRPGVFFGLSYTSRSVMNIVNGTDMIAQEANAKPSCMMDWPSGSMLRNLKLRHTGVTSSTLAAAGDDTLGARHGIESWGPRLLGVSRRSVSCDVWGLQA